MLRCCMLVQCKEPSFRRLKCVRETRHANVPSVQALGDKSHERRKITSARRQKIVLDSCSSRSVQVRMQGTKTTRNMRFIDTQQSEPYWSIVLHREAGIVHHEGHHYLVIQASTTPQEGRGLNNFAVGGREIAELLSHISS